MLLGIDLGTGSVKALLLAIDGTIINEASSPYPVHAPQPGWAESNPQDWWSATAIAVRSATQGYADQVQAIGLSGQMHGIVLTDPKANPLRPAILWADTRSTEMLPMYTQLPLDQRQRLANPIATGMAGASLLWLRQFEPKTYTAAQWVLQPKDWLRFQLTGAAAAEPSDASATLLYDLIADDWAWDTIDALALRSDWLPKLIPSSQIAGSLTPEAAAHLGLPPGLPIAAGAGDTAAAALGSELTPGVIQLTVGTAAQIITLRSQPFPDPHGCTHLYRAALPQQWYTLAAIQNAGLALEWAREILGMSWAEVYTEAITIPSGSAGLTFLPYLTGDRTPHLDPQIRGAWVGMGLHHTRAHLMRSALEGIAFSLRQGLEALLAAGVTASELRLAGGGSIEPTWRQLLADVLQMPLQSVTVTAASAKGAALLAAMALQIPVSTATAIDTITSPQPPNAELEAAWQRFCDLYPRLRPMRD